MSEVREIIQSLLKAKGITPPLASEDADGLAAFLGRIGKDVYPRSIVAADGVLYFLARDGIEKFLCIGRTATEKGEQIRLGEMTLDIEVHPADPRGAALLREKLPFTSPQLIGLKRALGCGDRLGIATPAHVRAVRGTGVAPFFAQQSIREMTRTERTPQQVMDSATYGVFQEGWRDGFGADADHLKTVADIDACLEAGVTFFTVEPGEYVDNEAATLSEAALREKFEALPWDELETTPADVKREYVGKNLVVSDKLTVRFTETDLLRAAVKYGRAVAHAVKMYRHLEARAGHGFELEMSVDETATPTTIPEHYFVAAELKRLGVKLVSLAPRFVGEFEKGVDYKGSLEDFETAYVQHLEIARSLGPYKLSIHSGSDKFSIYPIAAGHSGELVHVKTAGTSYLEALRAVGRISPDLFREILAFAFERYDEDKATYHVSADPSKVPVPEQLKDEELASVLDIFDGRQLLHVTYGSVLTARNTDGSLRFKDRILLALRQDEETHYEILEKHMRKHVEPFGGRERDPGRS